MPYADLHVHSTHSDGVLDCPHIVERAENHETLQVIAISDHDTLEGAKHGLKVCANSSITCIPAVEISTKTNMRDVHLLGYFIDLQSNCLDDLFNETREKRRKRTLDLADRLHDAGFPISAEEVLSACKIVNRSNLARMLVERGCSQSVDDCFLKLIGSKSPYYVDVAYPDTVEAIHLVREAGGYPFVAHPAHYQVVDLLEGFKGEGLVGLEAFHSMQTAQQSADLIRFAKEHDLAVSGGSDWHGDATHGTDIGGAGLEKEAFELFLSACERS